MSSLPALMPLRGSTFVTGPPVSLPAVASISAVWERAVCKRWAQSLGLVAV